MPTESDTSALLLTFAHDLRVPLRSIVMTAQRIQRRPEEFSAETRSKLDEILAAARRQEELIAAVVEYDQALQPGLASDTPLALRLAIQTACMKVDAYRQACQGTVAYDADAVPKVLVPSGISRVIEKILHNSLKFHSAGSPPVVHVDVSEDSTGGITITVQDQGIGIEPVYREAIFQPFRRLNPASEYPGSGLGLSICQRLVESVGGTIRVGDLDEGLSMVIRIPKWESAS